MEIILDVDIQAQVNGHAQMSEKCGKQKAAPQAPPISEDVT